jgi:uncharacterized protein (DUF488 family)
MMNNKPKFYRQCFLLSLLRIIDREVTKTDLQKHSFLFSQQHAMGYDFIPYQYGCYSFQLNKDIEDLAQSNFVKITDNKIQPAKKNPIPWLKTADSNQLLKYPKEAKKLYGDDLISFVYRNYPYYAINSKIINRVCSDKEKSQIQDEQSKITKNSPIIYTVGYEGISLEIYINKLIKNNIKLLCDVRKNPFSRKFGFNYKTLSSLLPKTGIDYIHIPQLGIESDKRQGLDNKEAYKKLFDEYKTTLSDKQEALDKILNLQKKYQRIALTCFEKLHRECHRHCVSDYLANKHNAQTVHL